MDFAAPIQMLKYTLYCRKLRTYVGGKMKTLPVFSNLGLKVIFDFEHSDTKLSLSFTHRLSGYNLIFVL